MVKISRVKDTSGIIRHGIKPGDSVTPGVVNEIRRGHPSLAGTLMRYVATGAVEVYSLPGTITYYLTKLSILSIARKNNLNPSETDLEVMVAGVENNELVDSTDSDINNTLAKYYAGLAGRAALATAEYYTLAQTPGGQQAMQSILNIIGMK